MKRIVDADTDGVPGAAISSSEGAQAASSDGSLLPWSNYGLRAAFGAVHGFVPNASIASAGTS
jgi:hypothetical protein